MEDSCLGIGIPISWPYVPSDFFDSFVNMQKPGDITVIRAASGSISQMRNHIAERALDLGCTHLLFLDADMMFPEDTIPKLLSHDKDIVGGLCFKRLPPFTPTLFVGEKYEMTVLDPWPRELVEVTATGTACLMIKTDVFVNMDLPWFEFTTNEMGNTVGEDIGFCYKARDLGYKIYVDTTIETHHLTQMRVNENVYRTNKRLVEEKMGVIEF